MVPLFSEEFTSRHGVRVKQLSGCCARTYLDYGGAAYCSVCGEQIRKVRKIGLTSRRDRWRWIVSIVVVIVTVLWLFQLWW